MWTRHAALHTSIAAPGVCLIRVCPGYACPIHRYVSSPLPPFHSHLHRSVCYARLRALLCVSRASSACSPQGPTELADGTSIYILSTLAAEPYSSSCYASPFFLQGFHHACSWMPATPAAEHLLREAPQGSTAVLRTFLLCWMQGLHPARCRVLIMFVARFSIYLPQALQLACCRASLCLPWGLTAQAEPCRRNTTRPESNG